MKHIIIVAVLIFGFAFTASAAVKLFGGKKIGEVQVGNSQFSVVRMDDTQRGVTCYFTETLMSCVQSGVK